MTDQRTIDEIRARLKLNLPFISASGCDYSVNEADYIEALTDCNWLLTALDEARRENERLRETLEWYADRDGSGKDFLIYQKNDKSHYVISDVHQLGSRARSALAAGEPKEGRFIVDM